MSSAIVVIVPDDVGAEVARLVAAALSLNGYGHDKPYVIPGADEHFVIFGPDRWTVEHSVRCRLSGRMDTCSVHTAIAAVAEDGVDTDELGRWRVTDIDEMGLPSLERAGQERDNRE